MISLRFTPVAYPEDAFTVHGETLDIARGMIVAECVARFLLSDEQLVYVRRALDTLSPENTTARNTFGDYEESFVVEIE